MSELMNTSRDAVILRRRLLVTSSALALLVSVCSLSEANAADTDHPPLWIELGWHEELMAGAADVFAPPFLTSQPRPDFETISPLSAQKNLLYSGGAEGRISFQPDGSDWVFSAAIRHGRGNEHKEMHQTTVPGPVPVKLGHYGTFQITPKLPRFDSDAAAKNESHIIADFQAGKDVGLGLFGGFSTFGFGVRFAQFDWKSRADINAIQTYYVPTDIKYDSFHHHLYAASADARRSFTGIGPAISWDASAPLAGNSEGGEIALDWGVNAGLLFGRQKARVHHQTTVQYYRTPKYIHTRQQTVRTPNRSKTVIVPNLGGFAGLSFRYSNAKLSFGYRGDFFFSAMDGGIDTAKKDNVGFHGPFASISVGLGG